MVANAGCLKCSRELLSESCSLPLTSSGRIRLAAIVQLLSFLEATFKCGLRAQGAVGSGVCEPSWSSAGPGGRSHPAPAPSAMSLLQFQE